MGASALGTWQGIYLWEHRPRAPHRRTVIVHVLGETEADATADTSPLKLPVRRRVCRSCGHFVPIQLYPFMLQLRPSCRLAPPRTARPPPESFLPLNRDTFHILVSLADRDRHGYSVMQDVLERTDGALRLSPSSLYASIRRLLEQGLIEELAERPDPAHDDERRRYYRLTRSDGPWPTRKRNVFIGCWRCPRDGPAATKDLTR